MPWQLWMLIGVAALALRVRASVESWSAAAVWTIVLLAVGGIFFADFTGNIPDRSCVISAALLAPPVAFGLYVIKRARHKDQSREKSDAAALSEHIQNDEIPTQ
jgi:hypothetical protein